MAGSIAGQVQGCIAIANVCASGRRPPRQGWAAHAATRVGRSPRPGSPDAASVGLEAPQPGHNSTPGIASCAYHSPAWCCSPRELPRMRSMSGPSLRTRPVTSPGSRSTSRNRAIPPTRCPVRFRAMHRPTPIVAIRHRRNHMAGRKLRCRLIPRCVPPNMTTRRHGLRPHGRRTSCWHCRIRFAPLSASRLYDGRTGLRRSLRAGPTILSLQELSSTGSAIVTAKTCTR